MKVPADMRLCTLLSATIRIDQVQTWWTFGTVAGRLGGGGAVFSERFAKDETGEAFPFIAQIFWAFEF